MDLEMNTAIHYPLQTVLVLYQVEYEGINPSLLCAVNTRMRP